MKQIQAVALLALLSGLLIDISPLLWGNATGRLIGLGIAAVMNFSARFYSDKIALATYQVQPVGPDTLPVVCRTVQRFPRTNLPVPQVYVVPVD